MSIHPQDIVHSFAGVSQFPERRARHEVDSLSTRLIEIREAAKALNAKPDAAPIAAELVDQLCARHVTATRAYWAAEGRCMSWFVVGPANFPVAANQKRLDAAHRRMTEVGEHLRASKRRLARLAFPHGEGDVIRSADPEALQKLRAKLDRAKHDHEISKQCNRLARRHDWEAIAGLIGWKAAAAARRSVEEWKTAPFFPANRLAEVRRIEERIAGLERMHARGTLETLAAGGVRVVENAEAARIQLIFPDKPDEPTRSTLKGAGFRWAPSEGAWQRHLNNAGRYAAQRVLKALAEREAA